MGDFRLTPQQITILKALHRKQRDRRFADRLKAVVLLGSGSAANVAQALLIDEVTVRNHRRIFGCVQKLLPVSNEIP